MYSIILKNFCLNISAAVVQTINKYSRERWQKVKGQLVAMESVKYIITLNFSCNLPSPPPKKKITNYKYLVHGSEI
jgi:hypothetical protein